ncbi:MAG: S9 family peptidase [Bacteroidales bacterium]
MQRLTIILALFWLVLPAAQADNVLTPHKVLDLETVSEVAISPDQNYIAFTLNVPRPFDHDAGTDYRELYVYDVANDEILPFITGEQRVFGIKWTPSGDAVTFRANLPARQNVQVYQLSLRGGGPMPLTDHFKSVIDYDFIDDEKLAFVAEGPDKEGEQMMQDKGLRVEVFEEEWVHRNLYLQDLNTGESRQLTEDVTVFDFTVGPGGRYAAAAIAPRNLVDDSYMFKDIHLVDLETGEHEMIMDIPGKLGNMAFNSDGSQLAFRAASMMEDAVVGSLFVMDVDTEDSFGDLRNYAEGMELSVIDFAWKDDNTLLYAAEEGVDIVLSEQVLDQDERTILIEPEMVVFGGFHLVDDMIAMPGNTWEHPNELYTFDLNTSQLARHTDHNPWLADIELASQRKLVYDARDGMEIHGVLIYPLDYQEGETYPLINYIHGGPEAAVQNGWSTYYNRWGQVAAAKGYFVFMPNYRASSGRGVDFTMAGYGDLVGVEYEDVLDGIDHLIEIGYVDIDRVGIGGGSYGGYFSAWSATRYTDRFAAAVMFVGISNQLSKRHTTDIPWEDYMVHWGYWNHEDWEDVYSRSPVKYAEHSLTPTLILHGDADPRVNPQQSLEMYRALKMHGCAATRLIWYGNEGHGNARNVHKLDYMVRTMRWFDFYLMEGNPREEKPDKYPELGIE